MAAVTITAGVRDEASPVLARVAANAQASARQIDRASAAAAPGAQRSLFSLGELAKQLQRLAMSSSLVNGILGTQIPDAILTIAVKMPILFAPIAAIGGGFYLWKKHIDDAADSVKNLHAATMRWIKDTVPQITGRRVQRADILDQPEVALDALKREREAMQRQKDAAKQALDYGKTVTLVMTGKWLGRKKYEEQYKEAADAIKRIDDDIFTRELKLEKDRSDAVTDAREELLKDAKDALDAEYEYEQEQTKNFLRNEKEKADALKATADLREELLRDNSEALDAEYAHEKMRTDDYLRGLKEREEAERDAAQKKAESIKAGAKDKEAELNRRLEDVRRRERVRNAMLDAADPADVRQAESHQKRAYEKDERERQHRVDRAMKAMRKGQRLKPWQREIIEAGKQAQAPQKTAEEKLLEDIKNLQKETKDLIDKALKLQ